MLGVFSLNEGEVKFIFRRNVRMLAKNETVIEVVKATDGKNYLSLHQLFNWSTKICAIGVHKTPAKEILRMLTVDGEFFILTKDDETGEIGGFVGSIYEILDKKKHEERYQDAAKSYGAKYYDYNQYNCIFIVKNLTQINQETIEKLLNNREYLKQKGKKFCLSKFFSERTNQLYLIK